MKKVIFAIFIVCLLASCSWLHYNKRYISQPMFDVANELYLETKSLESVKNGLQDAQWRRAEINEALYRLKKVHGLEQE